jgi:ferredoxin-NADP reductase
VRLLSNDAATPTTRLIRIALDGETFPYKAGQAAAIGLAGQPPTPYSIASAPHETAAHGYLEFLVKVDGSTRFGSQAAGVAVGTPIVVSPAIGRFGLPPDAADHRLLFIAGGTGIAPLRSMLREVVDRGGSREPPAFIYSARTPAEFAYADELRALQAAGAIALTLTLTGEAADWAHARGRTGPAHLDRLVSPDTLCYICGPPSMVTDLPVALTALGVRREQIRTEDW